MLCLLREAFKFKTSLGMSRFIICAFVMMHMMSRHSRSFSNWAAFIYCLVHLRHYISHHAVWHSSLSTERTLSPRLETYIWSWWNNIGAYPAPFPSPFLFWGHTQAILKIACLQNILDTLFHGAGVSVLQNERVLRIGCITKWMSSVLNYTPKNC